MLHEISTPSLKGTGQWDVPAAICGELGSVQQGLYAFLFVNESDLDTYDNNPNPKVVVQRRGRSLKTGKFEQGLMARMQNYNAHLHRRQLDSTQAWVLQDSFRSGFVLDLGSASDAIANPARVFERYWSDAVGAFIDANRLLAVFDAKPQTRTEWRSLHRDRWTPQIQSEFAEYLQEVSSRVFAMIDVGRLPIARRHSMPVSAGPDSGLDMDEWFPESRLA